MDYPSYSVSIIIITKNRPDMIDRCLYNLFINHISLAQIIVVDSSSNEITKQIILAKYPKTLYLNLSNGKNNRHIAKNMGIKHADGEIVAFLDDDSIVQEGWLDACLNSYNNTNVGGVGGVIVDTNAPKEIYGTDSIGKITFNGTRIGNFDKDPGRIIEVDHLRGCNMSFRNDVLKKIDGFDLNYIGSNVLEETDLSIRVKKAGHKILFNPKMAVIHTAAPRESILRTTFNLKREFYIARNSTYFMFMNFGLIRTFAYTFTNNTNIPAFIRKPKFNTFYCIFVSIFGKIIGLLVAIKIKIKKNDHLIFS